MTERRRPGRARSGPADEGPARTGTTQAGPGLAEAGIRTAGRFPRPLACCLAVLSLSGCGATTDGSAGPGLLGAGAAAAVVLAGGSALVARRVTKRPLERARDQDASNLGAVLEERAGLAAERDAQERRLHAYAAERQALLQERENLLRRQDELTRQWTGAAEQQTATSARLAELVSEHDALAKERDELAKERDELEGSVDSTFVNLAMRTLTLVERQLVLIETLEGREADPAQLESLFRLDHLATRMRRNSENMLLLAGLENSHRSRKTVTLLDVVRAAVSEIERYERVRLGFLASIRLSGAVADDTSHLVAELLENATAFSPPQDQVEVGGWLLDNGELMISVTDRGIGLPGERLRALNEQLSEPSEPGADRRDALLAGALTGRSMGLFVVARLARRHGIRVQLRENAQGGGVTAMVMLPREALLQDAVTTTDLDDQRRAERTAASVAATARAQAEAAAVALPPVDPAPRPGAPLADGDLPVLPRRKPAAQAAEPTPERTVAPVAEHLPEQTRGEHPAPYDPPAAGAGPVTPLGLPRRVPRGNGLPGTGETPTSGLRRLAAEPEPAAAPAAIPTAPAIPSAPAGPARTGVSPEELRRRLGVFQGGLRRAARESAQNSGAAATGSTSGAGPATAAEPAGPPAGEPAVPEQQPRSAAVEGDNR